jgi:hypothetical protein
MADEPFIHEVLIRGHDPATGAEPAWHVEIATPHRDENGQLRHILTQLNMEQAAAAGYSEAKIMKWAHKELTGSLERERHGNARLRAENDELKEKVATLTAATEEAKRNGP